MLCDGGTLGVECGSHSVRLLCLVTIFGDEASYWVSRSVNQQGPFLNVKIACRGIVKRAREGRPRVRKLPHVETLEP